LLDNAKLETLADCFRWLEGLVWMSDANCLLFQDLRVTGQCDGSRMAAYPYTERRRDSPTARRVIVKAV